MTLCTAFLREQKVGNWATIVVLCGSFPKVSLCVCLPTFSLNFDPASVRDRPPGGKGSGTLISGHKTKTIRDRSSPRSDRIGSNEKSFETFLGARLALAVKQRAARRRTNPDKIKIVCHPEAPLALPAQCRSVRVRPTAPPFPPHTSRKKENSRCLFVACASAGVFRSPSSLGAFGTEEKNRIYIHTLSRSIEDGRESTSGAVSCRKTQCNRFGHGTNACRHAGMHSETKGSE